MPQRDASAAWRGASSAITDEMAFRFRDVYDHLVRWPTKRLLFQDRVTGILDAHLATRLEPAEPGHEGADGDVDDLHAADRADRAVGHERAAAALSRAATGGAVLVGGGHAWSLSSAIAMLARVPPQALDLIGAWAASVSLPATSPIRLPPAKSSSGRRRSSRNWSRTPSTPGARRIAITVELGGKQLIRVEDDGEGMDARGRAAGRRAPRHQQDRARPTTWSASRRWGFAARRCRHRLGVPLHAAHARSATPIGGTEIRVNGGAPAVGARGRRARRARRSRSRTCSTTCRRGASS